MPASRLLPLPPPRPFAGWRPSLAGLCLGLAVLGSAPAQQEPVVPESLLGETRRDSIPLEVEEMFSRGMQFLVETQAEDGSWGSDSYNSSPGVVGLCIVSLLAHGEDPNYGPYADTIHKAVAYIIGKQRDDGYLGTQSQGMYEHGFATLALAECYGAVDDDRIGPALRKAVDLLLESQRNNAAHAWRYQPDDDDADTTVSGAQVVALFAARNAGIEIPDEAFEQAVNYYNRMQSPDGGMGYSSPGGSNPPRSAIGLLVYQLARLKEAEETVDCLEYVRRFIIYEDSSHPFYHRYYMSQALFQADLKAFAEWNTRNIEVLSASQMPDGGWNDTYGRPLGTAFSLLSLALNYRFLPIYER